MEVWGYGKENGEREGFVGGEEAPILRSLSQFRSGHRDCTEGLFPVDIKYLKQLIELQAEQSDPDLLSIHESAVLAKEAMVPEFG